MLMIKEAKRELRKNILSKLFSLTLNEIKRRSKNVAKIIEILPIYKKAKNILVYYPLKGEVDILELVGKNWGKKNFLFPKMDLKKKELNIFLVKNLEDFVEGPFKVKEPALETAKKVDLKEIDLIILPGIAFNYERFRLGRGAGFYDRFLKRIVSPIQKIGVCFDFQVLPQIPTEIDFDEKVDLVITDSFVI